VPTVSFRFGVWGQDFPFSTTLVLEKPAPNPPCVNTLSRDQTPSSSQHQPPFPPTPPAFFCLEGRARPSPLRALLIPPLTDSPPELNLVSIPTGCSARFLAPFFCKKPQTYPPSFFPHVLPFSHPSGWGFQRLPPFLWTTRSRGANLFVFHVGLFCPVLPYPSLLNPPSSPFRGAPVSRIFYLTQLKNEDLPSPPVFFQSFPFFFLRLSFPNQ